MRQSDEHIPVLATELIALLQLEPQNTVVDLTLGRSGHAKLVVQKLSSEGTFIGFDADQMQISFAQEQFRDCTPKTHFIHSNFVQITAQLAALGIKKVDRIYADLGLSTVQLLDHKRGFSFQSDSALDMRLDPTSSSPSAAQVIASADEGELATIFQNYGEEHEAQAIAAAIVKARTISPILTGIALADIVKQAKRRFTKRIHPATQVFQALRMHVNDELKVLEDMLQQIPALLHPQGRLAILTFHSLEDRLVKNIFKAWSQADTMILVNKKVIRPTWAEKQQNPRARSSYLRVVEKPSLQ
ncbi:16S rRNA (cytosine(1402)-N(4))-methyltransferase RsmH [Candidatus Gracilibacteria bacterium]|nr:16S rRNA (cytosine(1402)-N(4))-methyltransferase RsmH [Candidatus Gracilibacteria bacterium]